MTFLSGLFVCVAKFSHSTGGASSGGLPTTIDSDGASESGALCNLLSWSSEFM